MPMGRRVARFNRRFANRLAGPIFTRLPGFGAVHHRGRRTGTEYQTPVKLFRDGADYVITLPYGASADWVRNVLAAGGCTVTTRGARVSLCSPRVTTSDAMPGVPAAARQLLARIGATELIVLSPLSQRAVAMTPDEGPSDAATIATTSNRADETTLGNR